MEPVLKTVGGKTARVLDPERAVKIVHALKLKHVDTIEVSEDRMQWDLYEDDKGILYWDAWRNEGLR